MANGSRLMQSGMESNRNNFPAKSPQFFRIIFSQSSRNHRLRIPTEFMRRYGNSVPNHVFLKVPTGEVWQAELRKSNGVAWLENGWKEFREFYTIEYGHFLVFRYDGNSHFHVLIFDRSTSEIEYPFSANHSARTDFTGKFHAKTECVEVDDSVEILEEFPASKTREKSPLSCSRPCKKTKTNRTCEEPNLNHGLQLEENGRDDVVEILDDFSPRQRTREKLLPPHFWFRRSRRLKQTDKYGSTSNTKAFVQSTGPQANRVTPVKSEKGQYSQCSMQGVGVDAEIDNSIEILDEFPTRDDDFNDSFEIKEKLATCRSREKSPVSYCLPHKKTKTNRTCEEPILNRGCRVPKLEKSAIDPPRTREKSSPQFRLSETRKPKPADKSSNHREFVQPTGPQGHRMKPVKEEKRNFPYRSMQGVGANEKQRDGPKIHQRSTFPAGRKQLASENGKAKALESAKAFKSKNPFFIVTMRSSYISSGLLNIPRNFVMQYLSKKHKDVILQVQDGRIWSAKFHIHPGNVKIQTGWNTFVQDIFLAVGDVCVFELINGTINLLEVVIFRASEDTDSCH
ncbi:unnamed protein product [Ilex paraguariensis]|uniref:TF-B3 domain-containing protein n=1 Tax=Ilex paraguariensis TaxID=185542 RepID=A0ABC8SJC3_9AQUA